MNNDKKNRKVRFSFDGCSSCTSIRSSKRKYTINPDFGNDYPKRSRHDSRRSRQNQRPPAIERGGSLPGGYSSHSTTSMSPSTSSSSSMDSDVYKCMSSSYNSLPADSVNVTPFVFTPPPPQPSQNFVYVVGDKTMSPEPVVIQSGDQESYSDHKKLAVVVFVLCGFVFGLIAFLLAVAADKKKTKNRRNARRLGRASLGISVVGIVVGISLAIGLSVGITLRTSVCSQNGHGSC